MHSRVGAPLFGEFCNQNRCVLMYQAVEHSGYSNKTYDNYEVVRNAAVFTHFRYREDSQHRHQQEDERDSRTTQGFDNTENTRVEVCNSAASDHYE